MRYYEKITIESAFANVGLINLHLFLEFIFFLSGLIESEKFMLIT